MTMMTPERFEHLADAYGGDLRRWPEAEREAARRLLDNRPDLAARLQAASASGKPVLLRIDYDAGHGLGSSVGQHVAQQADTYAFLWSQLAPVD